MIVPDSPVVVGLVLAAAEIDGYLSFQNAFNEALQTICTAVSNMSYFTTIGVEWSWYRHLNYQTFKKDMVTYKLSGDFPFLNWCECKWVNMTDIADHQNISWIKQFSFGIISCCSSIMKVQLQFKWNSPCGPQCTNSFITWWRHQMETFSALLALCAGNSPVPVNFPHKGQWRRALMGVFFDLRLNKRLSKQSWVWWFETLPRPLWRHSNVTWVR